MDSENLRNQKLFVMIGLSGSGKSTEALDIWQSSGGVHSNTIIVSSDCIREELCGDANDQSRNAKVFEEFHRRIRKGLQDGNDVIADATNLTIKSRKGVVKAVERIPCEKIAVVMATPFEECVNRDEHRDRIVSADVIERQRRRFQIPFYKEGFDDIQIVYMAKQLNGRTERKKREYERQ